VIISTKTAFRTSKRSIRCSYVPNNWSCNRG